jgi:sarcosine oxidase
MATYDSIYDSIVIGAGGAGSAALYHLAKRGARVLGLDRFGKAHDRGSSHGATRIIRQAYYEHPDYVPLLLRAYKLWEDLSRESGRELFRRTGLLQVGPIDGAVLPAVRRSADTHGLDVEELSAAAIEARFPGFRVPGSMAGILEPAAGYLRVEECVLAHLDEAEKLGAELVTGHAVRRFGASPVGVEVETDHASYRARSLVVTPGAWAGDLLSALGVRFEVRRKAVFWYESERLEHRVENGCPTYLFETARGIFYGFPRLDARGVKVAEHTGGQVIAEPLAVDRALAPEDERRVVGFLAEHLPGVGPRRLAHSVCLYTMTPDEHYVIDLLDRGPRAARVAFAAGLSGHGFKLTGVIGEALADLALAGRTELPIGFLSRARFR